MSRRWCVVGGGLLGLTTALRLAQRGEQVEVLEAAPLLGGLASAWDLGGVRCDRHYHVILPTDSATIAVLGELGLSESIVWRGVRTGLFGADGTLYDASDAMQFLRHAPLRVIDKARLGLTVGAALSRRDGSKLEQIGVEAWLRRWSGGRAFDTFWAPLLRAKLGDGYHDASATFIWATLRRLMSARRSGLDDQRVGYLPGGWGPAIDALAATCAQAGVTIRTGTPVRYVRAGKVSGTFDVVDETWVTRRYDNVAVTLGANRAADLCPDLSTLEHDQLERVRYQGIVCVAALLPQELGGYYLTNITDPGSPITGVIEMTALMDSAELGGHTLVYLPRYVEPNHRLFGLGDAAVTAEFLDYLWRIFPDARSEPIATAVSRVRDVFAVPTLGYSSRMPPIATSLPGLYLAGSAQLPFSPLNVNDTLGLVDQLLDQASVVPRTLEKAA